MTTSHPPTEAPSRTPGTYLAAAGAVLALYSFFGMPYLSIWFTTLSGAQLANTPEVGLGVSRLWLVPATACVALALAFARLVTQTTGSAAVWQRSLLAISGLSGALLLLKVNSLMEGQAGSGVQTGIFGMILVLIGAGIDACWRHQTSGSSTGGQAVKRPRVPAVGKADDMGS